MIGNHSSKTNVKSPVSPCTIAQDAALIDAMLGGNSAAWSAFHVRYDALMAACIARTLGRFSNLVSSDDIDEACGRLIVQLLSNDMLKLRSFDPARGSRLSTWLGMLAMHAAYDLLRERRRECGRSSLTDAASISCEWADPFGDLNRREQEQALAGVMNELSERDRKFMNLYFSDELEPEQVAAAMGISVKTVYSKKHKICSRLERMLGEQLAAA